MSTGPPPLPDIDEHGGERQMLEEFLDFYRASLVRKMFDLDDAQLAVRLAPSTLSLGGLWFHMAVVEDSWFSERLHGDAPREPWASAPWDEDRDWELNAGARRPAAELRAVFDEAVEHARAQAARCDSLDQITAAPRRDGSHQTLRWIYLHMIEEYARHCGHADLIRETIDGFIEPP